MSTNKLEITYKGGFKPLATERSKELVKDVYYAMKRKNKFYDFQRSFLPMKGMTMTDEQSLMTKIVIRGEGICFNNIRYIPKPKNKETATRVPQLWYDLLRISRMLCPKDSKYDFYGFICPTHMTKTEALGHYVDFIFKDYCKTKKLKPTGTSLEFLFGLIGTVLFTITLFICLSVFISKGAAFIFGSFIAMVTLIGLIFLVGD